MDLVILAAGMGSRFGGLKQLEPIDENGNFIIDYSIFDAKRAGFDRVVFIIKEENYEIFKSTIGARVEKYIETDYAFQTLDSVPEGFICPSDRVKPLGTAHAILSAASKVKDKFIIINADDFYGQEAFDEAANFLKSLDDNSKNKYCNIAYHAGNTLTDNGSVKRGVCIFDDSNNLKSILESELTKDGNNIKAKPLNGDKEFGIIDETLVSMNMMAFTPDIMEHIKDNFPKTLGEKDEYLIPELVSNLISDGKISVNLASTKAEWMGVTYPKDKESVVAGIKRECEKGKYPKNLFKSLIS